MATRKKVDTTAGSPHIGEDLPGVPQGGGGVAAEPHIGEGLLVAQGDDVARDAALPAAPAGEPVEDTRMPGDAPAMPGEAGGAMPPGGMGGGGTTTPRAPRTRTSPPPAPAGRWTCTTSSSSRTRSTSGSARRSRTGSRGGHTVTTL